MFTPRTLIDLLEERVGVEPDADAFLFRDTPHSRQNLWQAINRVAASLILRGCQRRSRVVVALPNGPEFFAVFYGIQRAGATPVPAAPESGFERLQRLARRCDATLIVGGAAPMGKSATSTDSIRADELLQKPGAEADPGVRFPTILPTDLAYIQFTSGTTGEPKGVCLSHAHVLANIRQLTRGFEITSEDVFVSWLPAHHDMGLVLMTMVPFALGARLVLLPARIHSLRSWLGEMERHGATFTAAPDFGYRMALKIAGGEAGAELSTLRVALNAAEPVRVRTIDEFEKRFGLRGVMIAGYGLAEATVGVAAWHPGRPPLVDGDGNVSVGKGFPDVEIAIVTDRGFAAAGEPGEIVVRSPANTSGYWGEEDGSTDLFRRDRYLRTGDRGYLDSEGNLFVSGRLKEMIIQAGRTIAPREVEEIVDGLDFVRRSAAIGFDRGDAAGEQLYLFAETTERSIPSRHLGRARVIEIVDLVSSHLGLRPGRVYLTAPRTIPFTANGKIRYGELRDAYARGQLKLEKRLWYPDW